MLWVAFRRPRSSSLDSEDEELHFSKDDDFVLDAKDVEDNQWDMVTNLMESERNERNEEFIKKYSKDIMSTREYDIHEIFRKYSPEPGQPRMGLGSHMADEHFQRSTSISKVVGRGTGVKNFDGYSTLNFNSQNASLEQRLGAESLLSKRTFFSKKNDDV